MWTLYRTQRVVICGLCTEHRGLTCVDSVQNTEGGHVWTLYRTQRVDICGLCTEHRGLTYVDFVQNTEG